MYKRYGLFIIFSFILLTPLFAATDAKDAQAKSAAIAKAKSEYKLFLEELKKLNEQYKDVTAQIREVVQEEGLPTIDDKTGEMTIQKPGVLPTPKKKDNQQVFGDVDVREMDDEILVKMDLPGVEKDELSISIENDRILKVAGKRDEEDHTAKTADAALYSKYERLQGSFERRVELPALADEEGTSAEYDNGVLTIRVRKASQAKKEVSVAIR